MTIIDHAAISEQGPVRGKNEDSISFTIPTDATVAENRGSLFVVADGVGGHGAGDVASSTAAAMIQELYYKSHHPPEKALKSAFGVVNLKIFDLGIESNRFRMQTTLSALAIVGNTYFIAHIGDSRIYRFRESDQVEQLTVDHSEVSELVKLGIITPDKIRTHPRRSIITRSVGGQTQVQTYTRSGEVREGDIFVLCTDGIWEPVLETEMQEFVTTMSPRDACQQMINLGIERDVRDNLSLHVLKVISVPAGLSRQTISINEGVLQKLIGIFQKK